MGNFEASTSPAIASLEEKCAAGVALVIEELGESEIEIDKRAVEYAGFIVNGLVHEHFKLRRENPNPVHERIHDILQSAGIVSSLAD